MLLEELNLPEKSKISTVIHKKNIYENAELKKSERDLIKSDIEKVIWEYSLKEDNINVKQYLDEDREYIEIHFFTVILRAEKNYKKIAEIIQNSIPYPIIINFEYEDKIAVNAAVKRINKNNITKMIVVEEISTDWIDFKTMSDNFYKLAEHLNIKNQSYKNFYEMYKNICDKIVKYNLSIFTGDYEAKEDSKESKAKFETLKELNEKIDILKNKIGKEKHSNKRAEMIREIKGLNLQIEEIL